LTEEMKDSKKPCNI